MKRTTVLALACTSLLGLIAFSINAGCSSDEDAPVTKKNVLVDSGTAEDAGTTEDAGPGCPVLDGGPVAAQTSKVSDIADEAVAAGTCVSFEAVVTTQKMLVSASKSGSCLWGIFVKAPDADRGVQVVSYGKDSVVGADGGSVCEPGDKEAIPDGIKVGDIVEVIGFAGAYPTSGVPQIQVNTRVKLNVKSNDPTKAQPVVVTADKFADIIAGKKEYRGLLVRLENVTAQGDNGDAGAVGKYGVVKVDNNLEIHDKFYYANKADDAIPGGAPVFPAGQSFKSIVGIVHRDYDIWCVQPRNKCTDFDPKSGDCK